MLASIDIVLGFFLAYYWTGMEMVLFHSQLDPVDRPGYVDTHLYRRFFSGTIWPVVAKMNHELAWFFVCFLSGAIVFSFIHALAYPDIGSTGLIVVAIAILRSIPGISAIVNAPLVLLAMVFWVLFAKPFGAKVPSGIGRIHGK